MMGVLEKISENLQFAEAKRNGLRKSIFMLMVDWRNFDKHLETTQKCFRECLGELESREKHLNSVLESVSQNSQELKVMRRDIEEKVKEVDEREKELRLFYEKGIMEMGLKEEWVLGSEKFVDEFVRKEGKLSEKEKTLNELFGKLEVEKNEVMGMMKLVEERIKEMGLKEKSFEERRKEIEKSVSELDDRERKIEEREKKVDFREFGSMRLESGREIQMKEEEVNLMREDLEFKEKEIGFVRELNEKREKELEMREKHLETKKRELEIMQECLKKFDLKKKECQSELELLEEGNKELELKKKKFEEDWIKGTKELEMREKKHLEKKKKELQVTQECLKEFDLKEKECQLEKELLEQGNKEFELKKKEFEERMMGVKELEMREKELENEKKELEVAQKCLKEFDSKKKECQLEKELIEKENRELELKKKKFELREKELEFKEKKLNVELHALVKTETVVKVVDESLIGNSSSPHFIYAVEIDGLDLHMFINGHEINLNSVDEVYKALQVSGDPAYFVLNAMETLNPPYLRKVDIEFEGRFGGSCIRLLEQLIRISPKIQSFVRDEAFKLARDWKAMMKTGNSLEVLGFLYLLASFDLAASFDTEEVMNFVGVVARHQQAPELCRRLGFMNKIPGLIQKLLNSKPLEAIKFIYAFELVDHFPPVPILKNYLKHVKKLANTMAKKRCSTKEAQNEAIDKRVTAMRAVIRCILNHKLESQYSPKILEGSIHQLLMLKVQEKDTGSAMHHKAEDQTEVQEIETPSTTGSAVHHKAQNQQEVEGKDISSTTLTNCSKAHRTASDLSNTDIGPPHAMALILANMNGKSLLSFLDSHLVEHELLQNEVSTALQISNDSAKLVLDAVEAFYHSDPQEQEARSCILLLEQLMRLLPHIDMDVNEKAEKIGFDWKARIRAELESPLEVLGFLLFISTFRLASAFDANELLHLYNRVVKHQHVPGLCQALGISKLISESEKTRSENLHLNTVAASSSVILPHDVKSPCSNVHAEGEEHVSVSSEIPMFIQNSSDPAQLVLDALQNCHSSYLRKVMIPQLVVKSFFDLLKHLTNVSPEIKPSVKERAFKFAVEWKSKLRGTDSWEVLGFLQLLASYELSSSFSAAELLGLLEISCQLKEARNLFRIFGLEDEVPGFILGLIKKKQLLLAFEYVYEFNLVDKIPPVALLKKHISHSRQVAREILNDGRKTPEAQEKAMVSEISALKSVIKCSIDHGLQSEYSADQLRQEVAELESQRVNLKTSIAPVSEELPKVDTSELPVAPEAQLQQDTKKRPATDNANMNEAQLPPPNKSRRLATPAEAAPNLCLGNGRHFHSPSSQNRAGLYTERCGQSIRTPVKHYSLGGSTPITPHVNHLTQELGSDIAGNRNIVHAGFPSITSKYFPPCMIAGEYSFTALHHSGKS